MSKLHSFWGAAGDDPSKYYVGLYVMASMSHHHEHHNAGKKSARPARRVACGHSLFSIDICLHMLKFPLRTKRTGVGTFTKNSSNGSLRYLQ